MRREGAKMAIVYATDAQIAAYLGIAVGSLPSNIAKLKQDAMDLIDYATMYRIVDDYIDPNTLLFTDTEIATAVEKAMGAQIEYWLEIDPSQAIIGGVESFSIGKFSMKYAGKYGKSGSPTLSPRGAQYLNRVGLLFRGVGRIVRRGIGNI